MILLEIDKEKVLSLAMVPYTPSVNLVQMAAEHGYPEGDRVKMIPQLQILRRSDLSVIYAVLLTPLELAQLGHLVRALGKSLDATSKIVDDNFEDFRKFARKVK